VSYRRISNAEEQLNEALSKFVPGEHVSAVVDAIKELAQAMAEDQSDSDNRRGEYDPDY
jgi:hypothetical protein